MPYRKPMESGTRLTLAAVTDIGLTRSVNEDGFVVAQSHATNWPPEAHVTITLHEPVLVAVLDGTGGEEVWSIAARGALQAFWNDPMRRLHGLVAAAHAPLWRRSATPGERGAGAAATFVILDRDKADWAQVGDTRAYRLRQGFLERVTPEHSLLEEMLKSGMLTPASAADFPHWSVLTRALGVTENVEPSIGSTDLERGDRLLVCSDGISGELDDRMIARLLGEHDEPGEACRALVDAANRAGGRDNMTAMVAAID